MTADDGWVGGTHTPSDLASAQAALASLPAITELRGQVSQLRNAIERAGFSIIEGDFRLRDGTRTTIYLESRRTFDYTTWRDRAHRWMHRAVRYRAERNEALDQLDTLRNAGQALAEALEAARGESPWTTVPNSAPLADAALANWRAACGNTTRQEQG